MRIKLSIFLVGIFCLAVINCKSIESSKSPTKSSEAMRLQSESLKKRNKDFVVMPGQVTLIDFPYYGPFAYEELICDDKEIPFNPSTIEHRAYAYLARSYFADNNNSMCEFRFSEKGKDSPLITHLVGTIIVREFIYPHEELRVEQSKVVLSAADQKRVDDESQMLKAIYKAGERLPLFDEEFSAPDSMITSAFGTKRVFNNKVAGQHLGTDYRARIGTQIFSANKGRVVFAGDLFFGGNTVVIDHGLGIFSSYSHLSKILVAAGQSVDKKGLVGLSGKTGRVNGPHLHWGIKVHENWVDGASLVAASKENFAARENKGDEDKAAAK